MRKHVLEQVEDLRDRSVDPLRISRSWSESPLVVCFVYRSVFGEGVLGLRIQIDPQVGSEDSARDIVDGDMGEPLGKLGETLSPPDEHGIRWWGGDPPEIRTHARRPPSTHEASGYLF